MYRVLVVDDDPMVTRLLRNNLELEGFEVKEAWEGKRAMEMLQEEAPDLLVLDIMMPRMDGWEVLKRVREDENLKGLPVVVLTAKVQDENIARGWKMGADGYITKPFNPVVLAESLLAVIESSPEEREARRKEELEKLKHF